MALAITELEVVGSAANAANYSFGSQTPPNGSLIIAIARVTGSADAGAIISDNEGGSPALTWTQRFQNVVIGATFCIYSAIADGSAHTVYYNGNGDAGTGANMHLFYVTGFDATTPFRQTPVYSTGAASNPPTTTLAAATLTTSLVVSALITLENVDPITWASPEGGSTWTEGSTSTHVSPSVSAQVAWRLSGYTSDTVTWGTPTVGWGCPFFEIAIAAGGATPKGVFGLPLHGSLGGPI